MNPFKKSVYLLKVMDFKIETDADQYVRRLTVF